MSHVSKLETRAMDDIYGPHGVLHTAQLPIVVLLQYLTVQVLSLAKSTRISSTISSFVAAMSAHILSSHETDDGTWFNGFSSGKSSSKHEFSHDFSSLFQLRLYTVGGHLQAPLMMLIQLGHPDLEILDHTAVLFQHLLKAS